MHTTRYDDPTHGANQLENAILVGVDWSGSTPQLLEEHLAELRLLAETARVEVIGQISQRRDRPDASTFIGKGKATSLVNQAHELDCSLLIFDDDLTPAQQKNLQRLAGDEMKIIDRSGLILDIFARHARSREAKTQVELAQLQYLLPRLTRQWSHLERQMGGIGTRGGPGEAQIEVDRRLVRTRIKKLKDELKHIAAERVVQNLRRKDSFRIALVGYTNSGKSTLMNALTDADVYVKDRLFATLDTTTRRLRLDSSQNILLSDTVGFIRKLPHHLIASFRSTLSEVSEADLLLKVVDVSSPQAEDHFNTINEVLQSLGLNEKPSIVVLNKLDLISDKGTLKRLQYHWPESVVISARQRLRLDQLEEAILKAFSREFEEYKIEIPAGKSKLISTVYDILEVKERSFEGDMTVLTVRGPKEAIESVLERITNIEP
ncbi:GTPase HflX [Candidatus Neomarinimicrobiota bacterium]